MGIEFIDGGVTAAKGFLAGGVHCGIRKNKSKLDLGMIYSDVLCNAAAAYTQNLVKGAPILVTQKNLENGTARAVIVNSGNANTGNADGIAKAQRMCEIAGEELGIPPSDVIVASTGVIGQELPIEPIEQSAKALHESLSYDGSGKAALAIMTTDTYTKEVAVSCEIGGKTVVIGGIAKGSGMIHPNMATMLSFVTTDCAITPAMLKCAINKTCDETFNMISVDGDTSTNDTYAVLASGLAGNPEINCENEDFAVFCEALESVCRKLAMLLAGDGEGATKLLICKVLNAADSQMAKQTAKAIISSSLIKAAMFGEDANCGRILCAVGYAGVPVDPQKIDVSYSSSKGEILVCENGNGIKFSEEKASAVLSDKEITIIVDLKLGSDCAVAYGCDLTYDYVRINGDYRT